MMNARTEGFYTVMQSGDEALQNDKPNDAITAYNIALSLAQAPLSDAEALTRRGAAHYQKGDFDRAIADCGAAIKRKRNYPHAYLNRGLAYVQTGKIGKALEDYTKAIHYNPDYAEAYICRGQAYYQISEFDMAIADYYRAIELDPQNQRACDLREAAQRRLEN